VTLAQIRRDVPTHRSDSRSSTVFRPGVEKARATLTPSPICSPSRVPLRYFHVSRHAVVQGVVDVERDRLTDEIRRGDASAVALSVVAARATGTNSRMSRAAIAASFPTRASSS